MNSKTTLSSNVIASLHANDNVLDSDTLVESKSDDQLQPLTHTFQPTSDSDYDHVLSQLHQALTKTRKKVNTAEVQLLNKDKNHLGRKESTGRSLSTVKFKSDLLSIKNSVSTRTASTSEVDEEYSSNARIPMQGAYAELVAINDQLKRQSQALLEKQHELDKREATLAEMEDTFRSATSESLRQLVEVEIEDRWCKLKMEAEKQITELETALIGKVKESKRLQDSYHTIKAENDKFRSQLDNLSEQNLKYQTQISTLNRRLKNLQQKHAFAVKKASAVLHTEKAGIDSLKKSLNSAESKPHQRTVLSKESSGMYDLLSITLEWIVDVHLSHVTGDSEPQDIKKSSLSLPTAFLSERCSKVLPFLAEILPLIPSGHSKIQQPCLHFIYWSLVHLDIAGSQRAILVSTYRRIGEELFKPTTTRSAGDVTANTSSLSSNIQHSDKNKCNLYLYSSNLRIRILSALIILKTINQADRIASVLEVMHKDLMTDMGKEILLQCKGTMVLTMYMKASNKVLLERVVDLMLLLSMESLLLNDFLNSCSNESWYRSCNNVLRSPGVDPLIVEKLSIILQRLSKLKNKHLFDLYQMGPLIQELLRNCEPSRAFLATNLRSILINMNVVKP